MEAKQKTTLRQAVQHFYRRFSIKPDGGINDRYIAVDWLKGPNIYLPNVEARKNVLPRHDMHHALTGYEGNMKGEVQISAWEVATGCWHNWVAILLNLSGMKLGAFLYPMSTWRAFLRGKAGRNLYKEVVPDDQLLEMEVHTLREKMGLTRKPEFSFWRRIKAGLEYTSMLLLSILLSIGGVLVVPMVLGYSMYVGISQSLRWQSA